MSRKELNYQFPDTITIPSPNHDDEASFEDFAQKVDGDGQDKFNVEDMETKWFKEINFDAISIEIKGKHNCFELELNWVECISDEFQTMTQSWYNELDENPDTQSKLVPKPMYDQIVTVICESLT